MVSSFIQTNKQTRTRTTKTIELALFHIKFHFILVIDIVRSTLNPSIPDIYIKYIPLI